MGDAAYTLLDYVQGLDNFPSEIVHIFSELKDKDSKSMQLRTNINLRENKIAKFIKQHGSLTDNPFESKYEGKITSDYERAIWLQEEKVALAEQASEVITRHMNRLDDEIRKLEADGVRIGDAPSISRDTPTTSLFDRVSTLETGGIAPSATTMKEVSPQTMLRPPKRKSQAMSRPRFSDNLNGHAGDDDSRVYCFCQQVSYGEMVACDNEKCVREWFHLPCVGLTVVPAGSWYCNECSAKLKRK